jgi:hypothetical protein
MLQGNVCQAVGKEAPTYKIPLRVLPPHFLVGLSSLNGVIPDLVEMLQLGSHVTRKLRSKILIRIREIEEGRKDADHRKGNTYGQEWGSYPPESRACQLEYEF